MSSGNSSWFQIDHIHLSTDGGFGLARLLRDEIDRALAPPSPVEIPPQPIALIPPGPGSTAARVGRRFTMRLKAQGGTPPYRWRLLTGRLPVGIQLAGSRVAGLPVRVGMSRVTIEVTDAAGTKTSRTPRLSVSL